MNGFPEESCGPLASGASYGDPSGRAGHAIGGTAGAEWQAPAGNAYFRTRVEIPD